MLLFWAKSDSDNFDLWRTDGTPEGTVRLKAIRQSEYNSSFPTRLVSAGGAVYFSAWDAEHGQELWKTDGTPEGTVRVKDLRPGIDWGLYYDTRLIAAPDGTVFFVAADSTHGFQLWKTNGTEAGTVLVTDSLPNQFGELSLVSWAHGQLYLITSKGELWASDGTREGTWPLATLSQRKPGSAPRWPVNMNGTLFFAANDGIHGEELWKSDGTREGSALVADLAYGNGSSYPSHLTPLNGTLLFLSGAWESGGSSFSLWRIDGTGEHLEYLTSISSVYGSPSLLVRMGDQVFFTRQSSSNYGDQELWKTDGTRDGTVRVKAVTGPPLGWKPMHLTAAGNRLFFVAEADIGRELLWTSDGTGPGTRVVADGYTSFKHLVAVGERLFFWASTQKGGYELWKSDGSAADTIPLMRVTGDIFAGRATAMGNTLFFIVSPTTGNGPELWKTDGRDPVRLKVFHDTPFVPSPTSLTTMKGALYFWAYDGVHGYELWKSDGTAEGTGMLKEIAPGAASAVGVPGPLVLAGPEGPLLFAASDGASGLEG